MDDVIHDFDLHQPARANQVACDFYVRLRWLRLAAWVIVHEHDG